MKEITKLELENVEGGALAGAIAGGILGFAGGCITGCAASIYYGDTSGEVLVKHMYVGASAGAAAGTVLPV